MNRPRIIFFPGLGADARLIEPQRSLDADIQVSQWIEPRSSETLAQFATRLKETLDLCTPFYLAGVSFGGMLAQEIASQTNPAGLILLSSCRCSRDLLPLRRAILCGSYVIPCWMISRMKGLMPTLRRAFGVVDPAQGTLLNDMLADTDPAFIRWSMRAILSWQGCKTSCPVLHIHGARDRIIPIRRLRPTHVIPDAGHVMNLTHATQVNGFVRNWLKSVNSYDSV